MESLTALCSFHYAVVALSPCFNANHSVCHLAFSNFGEFWADSFQRSGQGFQVSSGRFQAGCRRFLERSREGSLVGLGSGEYSWRKGSRLVRGRFRFCGVPGKGSAFRKVLERIPGSEGSGRRFCAKEAANMRNKLGFQHIAVAFGDITSGYIVYMLHGVLCL